MDRTEEGEQAGGSGLCQQEAAAAGAHTAQLIPT